MYRDSQNVAAFFYILCFEVLIINSKTSTLWKLNSDRTKIIEANSFHSIVSYPTGTSNRPEFLDDPLFDIITSTEHYGQSWVKQAVHYYCTSCQNNDRKNNTNNSTHPRVAVHNLKLKTTDEALDCGKPVNFTYYDNLVGVLNRNRHPIVPEPQAILYFNKNYEKGKTDLEEYDIDSLEQKLKRAKREVIISVILIVL